jgi:hypothetical protein
VTTRRRRERRDESKRTAFDGMDGERWSRKERGSGKRALKKCVIPVVVPVVERGLA